MGLTKTMVFHDNAYHKIMSVEFHREKRQLRIRTELFTEKQIGTALGITREYIITEKSLINESTAVAEKAVLPNNIKKIVKEEISAIEKTFVGGKILGKEDRLKLADKVKFSMIADKKKEIGENKFMSVMADIDKKSIMVVAYECLKMLQEFEGAKDC